MKVLIVEDEHNIALGIAGILRKFCPMCHSIQIVSDGQEACDFYGNKHLNLIITDIRMQQMNGLEMIDFFSKKDKQLQFIILSGYDDFCYAQQAIHYNVIEYLLKPIDTDVLVSAIQKAYEKLPEVYLQKKKRTLPNLAYFQFELSHSTYPGSIKKLLAYIEKNYMTDISLQAFSHEYMMNPNYLSGIIKKYTSQNFSFLLDYIRIRKTAEFLLYDPDLSISEISYLVGYNHERRLYQAFQKRLHCTPGEFRQTYAPYNRVED